MASSPSLTAQPGGGLWRRLWPLLAIVLLVAATVSPSFREPPKADWLNTYVVAAQQMVAHQPINDGTKPAAVGLFTYMPAGALYALPVAFAPPMVALAAWYLASLVAICIGIACSWRLMGGPPFSAMNRAWAGVFALGAFFYLRFIVSAFGNRQTDLLIGGAALAGCWFVAQKRFLRGAVWLGLAASIKGPPLLFAPYLAWRGRWRAAAWLLSVTLAVNLLPDLFWPRSSGSYLGDWRFSLAPVRDAAPGIWFADIFRNQSVAGVVGRFSALGFMTATTQISDTMPAMSAGQIRATKLLVYAIDLLLLGVTAFVFRRRRNDPHDSTSQTERAAELGSIICLMLLLSPMSAKAHMCVLVLPLLLIAREIIQRPTAGWLALGGLLALTGPLAASDLLGKELGDLTLAWGLPTLFVFLALIGMWKLARSQPPHAAS